MPPASPPPSCWCGNVYTDAGNLRRHRRETGHGDPAAIAAAAASNLDAAHAAAARALAAHPRATHTCSACGAAFPRRDKLERHTRLLHPPTTHTCGVCNLSLPSAERLATHAASHDDGLLDPLRELPEHEAQALLRDAELQQLRAEKAWRERRSCNRNGCSVCPRATAAGGSVALCCCCNKRFHPACMGYDPALVARGGPIICVPCLRREGRKPAAAITADRRRDLLYHAARRSGLEVVEVPADGWCMLNAALRAAGASMTKEALLRASLRALVGEGEPGGAAEGLGLLASAAAAAAADQRGAPAEQAAQLALDDGQEEADPRSVAQALLRALALEPSPSLTRSWDSALFDELPKSLAHTLGCPLEVWVLARGRVARQVFAGTAEAEEARRAPKRAKRSGPPRRRAVILRFNEEVGLAHYAAAVAPVRA